MNQNGGGELLGLPVARAVRELDETPDLAFVCTPASSVPGILLECAEKGIPGAVVSAVGFKESGGAGAALERELRQLERQHPELGGSDSPTQRVGGRPGVEFEEFVHHLPMLSLDNAYDEDEFLEFDARLKRALDRERIEYLAELKIDGLSLALHYRDGELERAVTRFVDYYNHERVHEAIGNVTPDDMYHGRQREVFSRREKIKHLTFEQRKKENLRNAA